MKACSALLAIFALTRAVFAGEKLVSKIIPASGTLDLQEFGGPHIGINVKAVYPSSIYIVVTDHTHMVPVTRANLGDAEARRGTDPTKNQLMLVPSMATRKVAKKDPRSYGDLRSDMFLIYEDKQSNLKVYYAEVGSAPIDSRELVVSIPEADAQPQPPLPEKSAADEPPPTPTPKRPAQSRDPQAISPELSLWYVQLQRARESLDARNAKAVEEFNRQVADYKRALDEARKGKR
jgi:hypothetical protein